MATLAEIRAGLAARAATISGLRTSPYMEPNPQTPMLCVIPRSAVYGVTFDGNVTYTLDLWLWVGRADLVRAQEEIDHYMAPSGAQSVSAAIDADQDLGGIVDYCKVLGWVDYARQLETPGGSQLLGASLQVEVGAS